MFCSLLSSTFPFSKCTFNSSSSEDSLISAAYAIAKVGTSCGLKLFSASVNMYPYFFVNGLEMSDSNSYIITIMILGAIRCTA